MGTVPVPKALPPNDSLLRGSDATHPEQVSGDTSRTVTAPVSKDRDGNISSIPVSQPWVLQNNVCQHVDHNAGMTRCISSRASWLEVNIPNQNNTKQVHSAPGPISWQDGHSVSVSRRDGRGYGWLPKGSLTNGMLLPLSGDSSLTESPNRNILSPVDSDYIPSAHNGPQEESSGSLGSNGTPTPHLGRRRDTLSVETLEKFLATLELGLVDAYYLQHNDGESRSGTTATYRDAQGIFVGEGRCLNLVPSHHDPQAALVGAQERLINSDRPLCCIHRHSCTLTAPTLSLGGSDATNSAPSSTRDNKYCAADIMSNNDTLARRPEDVQATHSDNHEKNTIASQAARDMDSEYNAPHEAWSIGDSLPPLFTARDGYSFSIPSVPTTPLVQTDPEQSQPQETSPLHNQRRDLSIEIPPPSPRTVQVLTTPHEQLLLYAPYRGGPVDLLDDRRSQTTPLPRESFSGPPSIPFPSLGPWYQEYTSDEVRAFAAWEQGCQAPEDYAGPDGPSHLDRYRSAQLYWEFPTPRTVSLPSASPRSVANSIESGCSLFCTEAPTAESFSNSSKLP